MVLRRFGYQQIAGLAILLTGLFSLGVQADTAPISREELQSFLKQPGNGLVTQDWMRQYQNKSVHWRGVVYQVESFGPNQPLEILLKIIPSSYLYDTVLIVPKGHPLNQNPPRKGDSLDFDGVVTGAVDTSLLKEVHITAIVSPQP